MYAIVETGGKQYQVEEGRYVDVELLDGEKDAKIVFDKIVMIVNGKKSKVGQPYVSGASAEGKIVLHDKSKKVIVQKTDNESLFAFSIVSLSNYGYVIEELSLDLHNCLKNIF